MLGGLLKVFIINLPVLRSINTLRVTHRFEVFTEQICKIGTTFNFKSALWAANGAFQKLFTHFVALDVPGVIINNCCTIFLFLTRTNTYFTSWVMVKTLFQGTI